VPSRAPRSCSGLRQRSRRLRALRVLVGPAATNGLDQLVVRPPDARPRRSDGRADKTEARAAAAASWTQPLSMWCGTLVTFPAQVRDRVGATTWPCAGSCWRGAGVTHATALTWLVAWIDPRTRSRSSSSSVLYAAPPPPRPARTGGPSFHLVRADTRHPHRCSSPSPWPPSCRSGPLGPAWACRVPRFLSSNASTADATRLASLHSHTAFGLARPAAKTDTTNGAA